MDKIIKNGITIHAIRDDVRTRIYRIAKEAAKGKSPDYAKNAEKETERLLAIADAIIAGHPDFDIIPLLPLTKKSCFPKNRAVIIADSIFRHSICGTENEHSNTYQLRVSEKINYQTGKSRPNELELNIEFGPKPKKHPPLYGLDKKPPEPN